MVKAYSEYDQNDIAELEDEQKAKVEEKENFYDTAIEETKKFYSDQSAGIEAWGKEQEKIQQAQTDLTIEGLEKAKEDTESDYRREQSAAYVDFKESTSKYGVEAEQLASVGLIGSGYAESSETRKYNAYQNRLAVNREAFKRTEAEFDLAIKDAELKNSAALAEIHYKTLTEKLYLQMQGFSAANELLMEKADAIDSINADYEARIQYILESIAERKAAEKGTESSLLTGDLAEPEEGVEDSADSGVTSTESLLPGFLAQGIGNGFPGASAFATLPTGGAGSGVRDDIPIAERMKEKDAEKNGTYTNAVNPLLSPGSVNKVISEGAKNAKTVDTDYYKGPLNSDGRIFGTFANGYQPKGISGHGKLTKSGQTYTFNTRTLSGEYKYVTQNVWKAEDGSLWYWDGRQNKYLPYHSGYRRSS